MDNKIFYCLLDQKKVAKISSKFKHLTGNKSKKIHRPWNEQCNLIRSADSKPIDSPTWKFTNQIPTYITKKYCNTLYCLCIIDKIAVNYFPFEQSFSFFVEPACILQFWESTLRCANEPEFNFRNTPFERNLQILSSYLMSLSSRKIYTKVVKITCWFLWKYSISYNTFEKIFPKAFIVAKLRLALKRFTIAFGKFL